MPTAVRYAGAADAAPPRVRVRLLPRLLQALLRALDGLAPVRRAGDYAPPPDEFYRHPPY